MRSCMPRPLPPVLQMHTVVEHPLTRSGTGSVSCRPLGQEPIQFKWTTPDGSVPKLENGKSDAKELPPGRYHIDAVDANGTQASVSVDVKPMLPDAVCIEGYRVTPASTTFSRDGSVEILGYGLEGHRFMWTNGVETEGCVLKNVPCGTYAAIPVGEKTPVSIHSSNPAKVDVGATGRWGM